MQTDKIMKNIFHIIVSTALAVLCLSACSSKEPYATAREDDAPRILNTDLPEGTAGNPAQLSVIERTTDFNYSIIVTPVKYCTIEWFIDGVKAHEGSEITTPLTAGNHLVKVLVTTTKGLSTSRTFIVAVRPVTGDPVLDDSADSRLTAPGCEVILTGNHLDNIVKVYLGATAIDCLAEDGLSFTVPADIASGEYLLGLEDAEGTRFGGVYATQTEDGVLYENFTVTVSGAPYVRETSLRSKAGDDIVLSGINLDKVQTISVNGQAASIVSQDATSLVFTCPELEAGEYSVSGTATDGSALSFGGAETVVLTVSSETIIFDTPTFVDWDHQFNGMSDIVKSLISDGTIHDGTIFRAYVNGSGIGALLTSWWRNPFTGLEGEANRGDIVIDGEQVLEYTLTADALARFSEQGAIFVGGNYTINKITIE